MTKRALTVLLIALSLGGCSFLGGHQKAYPKRYTLLKTSTGRSETQPSRHYPVVLRVATPSAPAWLSKTGIYYQLLYKQHSRISAYTQSRWVQPPPAMLAQALQQRLARTHAFKAVTGPRGNATAGLILHVTLSNLEQRFKSRHHSMGVLAARATLVKARTGHVLGQKDFNYKVTAPQANAIGGVQALRTASGKFTRAVAQWVEHTLAGCSPGCLRQAGSAGHG